MIDAGDRLWPARGLEQVPEQLLDATARDLRNVHSSFVTVLHSLFRAAAMEGCHTSVAVRIGDSVGHAAGLEAAAVEERLIHDKLEQLEYGERISPRDYSCSGSLGEPARRGRGVGQSSLVVAAQLPAFIALMRLRPRTSTVTDRSGPTRISRRAAIGSGDVASEGLTCVLMLMDFRLMSTSRCVETNKWVKEFVHESLSPWPHLGVSGGNPWGLTGRTLMSVSPTRSRMCCWR